jgi:hypothetical protein
MQFKDITKGTEFYWANLLWVKQSSRTAKPLFSAFANYYYFGQTDRCVLKSENKLK